MTAFSVEPETIALPQGAWAQSHRVDVLWQERHVCSLSQGQFRAYLFPVYTPLFLSTVPVLTGSLAGRVDCMRNFVG